MTAAINRQLERIAADVLGIATLETRNSDSLDFHDLAVWNIKAALERAYTEGRNAASLQQQGGNTDA